MINSKHHNVSSYFILAGSNEYIRFHLKSNPFMNMSTPPYFHSCDHEKWQRNGKTIFDFRSCNRETSKFAILINIHKFQFEKLILKSFSMIKVEIPWQFQVFLICGHPVLLCTRASFRILEFRPWIRYQQTRKPQCTNFDWNPKSLWLFSSILDCPFLTLQIGLQIRRQRSKKPSATNFHWNT